MSLAKKCDRCGMLYVNYGETEHDVNGIMPVHIDDYGTVRYKNAADLCPQCNEEFEKLFTRSADMTLSVEEIIDALNECGEVCTINPNELRNALLRNRHTNPDAK